jgi:hypothetical protein
MELGWIAPASETVRSLLSSDATITFAGSRPMSVTEMLTDNQIAVVGCFAALGVCGIITAISYHLGPAKQKAGQLEYSVVNRTRNADASAAGRSEERRAA